jgi:low density lipoprotein receptor-related protein 5/6
MTRALYSLGNATVATLALLIVTALAPEQAQSKVYFSAFLPEGGTGVQRAGFDGSGLQTLQSEPAGFEDGLALDTLDGKMYWTDTNAGVISSANMNGTETQIVIDDSGLEPLGIALDMAGGKIYWTDSEGVKRANLNGGERQLLTREPARGFLALDLTARRMYWADWPSGDIKTAAMAAEPKVTNIVTKQPSPFGIAVDHIGGKVYWLELNLNKKKSEKNEIHRAKLDGTEARTLLERPGAGFEGGLAIDQAAGKLYWGEAETHDIGVANLDGSQARTLFSTGEAIPEGIAVETTEPRPRYSAPPFIEGKAQVGSPLRCNAGSWTGVGPVFFGYRWGTSAGGLVEGASGGTYVPSSEDAGNVIACVVSASDNVETSTATSAGVKIAAFPAAVVRQPYLRLVAGIAYSTLRGTGTRARVPVFTSLPGIATLKATPIGTHRSRRSARSKQRSRHGAITVIVRQRLVTGRTLITLRRLVPGARYHLLLTIRSADGQTVRDTATLNVAKR